MPTFQGADPRLFNSYGALATGLQSGVDMSAKLQEVQLRREQQARLAEQAAYEQTQRAGLEEARRLQNAAAKKALETVIYDGAVTYEPKTQIAKDEDGNDIFYQGKPMLENIAGSYVKVESGRNPVTGVDEYRRTEANPIEVDKFVLEQTDRENRSQLERDRFDLEKQKVADGRKIIAGAGYFNTATEKYTPFDDYKAVPRPRSVTDMMALQFMGLDPNGPLDGDNGFGSSSNNLALGKTVVGNGNTKGTVLNQPTEEQVAAARQAALNPDGRFTNIFNAAQPVLVQPPPKKTAAEIAADAAKVVADAAKTGVPIGTGVKAGDPGSTGENPIILKSKDDFNSIPGNSYFRYNDGILRFKKGKTNDSSAPTDRIAIPAVTRSSWNTAPQGRPFDALNQPILDIVDAGAQQAMGLVNVAGKPLGALGNIIGTSVGYPAGAVRNLFDVNYSPENDRRREDILRSIGIDS